MAHPTARLFLQLSAQYKSWLKLNQCEREVGICCLGTQVQLFIQVLSVLSCDCLTCEWKYTSYCNGYRMVMPDSVRRWGYLVPFCKVTPNKIKQRKYTLLCHPSVFSSLCEWAPLEQQPSPTWLKKLLALWINSTVSNWLVFFLPAFSQRRLGNYISGQDVFVGFFVTVSQAEGRLKLCHVDRKPFLLCCANRAA